jgi:endonuclease/exonuclease/phosphatase family metal-dependent hydrolase
MVVGDFNETLGKDPTLMASVCAKFNLYDVVANVHGPAADIPTYIRGTRRRLDYCMLSTKLQSDVHAIGYNLFNQYAFSDHRTLFVDFDLAHTLGKTNPKMVPSKKRFVSTGDEH